MATNIATLAVKFVADTTGLKTGTSEVSGTLTKLSNFASTAGQVVTGVMTAIAIETYVASRALQAFMVSADRIDKTSKLAERLDLTYGSLQKLTFIAGRSDIEVGTLAKAMEHMGRTMGSGGMSLENRFAEQAKRIGQIKDPALRAAEAFKVFGKSGGELIPLMRNFAQDAARFDRFGGKFGFGIEDKDAKNVERMNDAWGDLVFIGTQLADKFVSKFGAPVAAFLENAIDLGIEWADNLSEIGVTWDNIGGFAVSLLTELNGFMALFSGTAQVALGTHQQLLGVLQLQTAALTRNNELAFAGTRNMVEGGVNISAGGRAIGDVLSGETGRKFQDAIINGTDLSTRDRFGEGSLGSQLAPSADKFSAQAARAINTAVSGAASPEAKAAMDSARDTAKVRQNTDKLVAIFAANPPVLALGGL